MSFLGQSLEVLLFGLQERKKKNKKKTKFSYVGLDYATSWFNSELSDHYPAFSQQSN